MSKKLVWLLEHNKTPFKEVKTEKINKKLFENAGIELSKDPNYNEAVYLEAPLIEFGEDDADNTLNENDRWYDRASYEAEVERLQSQINSGAMFGEPDHPEEGYSVSMKNISHMITKLWFKEDGRLWVQIKLLPTRMGRDLIVIHRNGGLLQGSARAIGYYDEDTKKAELDTLFCIDIVSNPGFSFMQFKEVSNATDSQFAVDLEDKDAKLFENMKKPKFRNAVPLSECVIVQLDKHVVDRYNRTKKELNNIAESVNTSKQIGDSVEAYISGLGMEAKQTIVSAEEGRIYIKTTVDRSDANKALLANVVAPIVKKEIGNIGVFSLDYLDDNSKWLSNESTETNFTLCFGFSLVQELDYSPIKEITKLFEAKNMAKKKLNESITTSEAKGIWDGWSKEEREAFLTKAGWEDVSTHSDKEWDVLLLPIKTAIMANSNVSEDEESAHEQYVSAEAEAEVDVITASGGEMVVLFNQSENGEIDVVAVINPDSPEDFISAEDLEDAEEDAYEKAVADELNIDTQSGNLSESNRKMKRKVRLFEAKKRRKIRLNEAMKSAEIIKSFFDEHPDFKEEYKSTNKHNDYSSDVRSTFSDYTDHLFKNGDITENQYNNVTLRYVGKLDESANIEKYTSEQLETAHDELISELGKAKGWDNEKSIYTYREQGDFFQEVEKAFKDKFGGVFGDMVLSMNEAHQFKDNIELSNAIDEITETLKKSFANPVDMKWDDVDKAFKEKYGVDWTAEADRLKGLNESGDTAIGGKVTKLNEAKFDDALEGYLDIGQNITVKGKKLEYQDSDGDAFYGTDANEKMWKVWRDEETGKPMMEEFKDLDEAKKFKLNESKKITFEEAQPIWDALPLEDRLAFNKDMGLDQSPEDVKWDKLNRDNQYIFLDQYKTFFNKLNEDSNTVTYQLGDVVKVDDRDGEGTIISLPSENENHYSIDFGNNEVYAYGIDKIVSKLNESDENKNFESDIKEYLIKEYGEDHFSDEDWDRMEFGDDGTVYIGSAQISTGIQRFNESNGSEVYLLKVGDSITYKGSKGVIEMAEQGQYVIDFEDTAEGTGNIEAIDIADVHKELGLNEDSEAGKGIKKINLENAIDIFTSMNKNPDAREKTLSQFTDGMKFAEVKKIVEANFDADTAKAINGKIEKYSLNESGQDWNSFVQQWNAKTKEAQKNYQNAFREGKDTQQFADEITKVNAEYTKALNDWHEQNKKSNMNESGDWKSVLPKEVKSYDDLDKAYDLIMDEIAHKGYGDEGNGEYVDNVLTEVYGKDYDDLMDMLDDLSESNDPKRGVRRKSKINEATEFKSWAEVDKAFEEIYAQVDKDSGGNVYTMDADTHGKLVDDAFKAKYGMTYDEAYKKYKHLMLNESKKLKFIGVKSLNEALVGRKRLNENSSEYLANPNLKMEAEDYKSYKEEFPEEEDSFMDYLENEFWRMIDDREEDEAHTYLNVLEKEAPMVADRIKDTPYYKNNLSESADDTNTGTVTDAVLAKIDEMGIALANMSTTLSKVLEQVGTSSEVATEALNEAKKTKSLFESVSRKVTGISKIVSKPETIITMNESAQAKVFKSSKKYLSKLNEDQVIEIMKLDKEVIEELEDILGDDKERELEVTELSEMMKLVSPVLSSILFLN